MASQIKFSLTVVAAESLDIGGMIEGAVNQGLW